MPKKISIAKNFRHASGNFSLNTKIIFFSLWYYTKNNQIAKKFPDSNATLLTGFFSLCPPCSFLHDFFKRGEKLRFCLTLGKRQIRLKEKCLLIQVR